MPECPHLSKNQIDKILNCQDSFLGKMQELDKVVKKFKNQKNYQLINLFIEIELTSSFIGFWTNVFANSSPDFGAIIRP